MRRLILTLMLLSVPLAAANLKLYLKDGSFHIVSEYQVNGDRVKFYSVERSDWEEMPVSLIDLPRTNAEAAARKSELDKMARAEDDEKVAARDEHAQIMKIPRDPGLYQLDDKGQLRVFDEIDSVVHNDKGRNVLRGIVPIVSGKAELELDGEHSKNVVSEDRPEFYLQLFNFESFALVKLTPSKGVRVVEKITVEPIVKEIEEQRKVVPTFQKELSDNGLYKIWPQDSLEKGEYAVMEYTESKMNQKVWDFRVE